MRLALLVCVCFVGVVHADVYPLEDVDRPTLLNPGMTTFDMSADVNVYITGTVPTTGQPTGYTHDTTSDLELSHQFGPVQATIIADDRDLAGTVLVRITHGGALFVGGDTFVDTQAVTNERALRGGYMYKLVAVPHRLAVYASGGLSLAVFDLATEMLPPIGVHDVTLFGSAAGELQLTRRLALTMTASFSGPLAFSPLLDERPGASLFATALFAFRRVDLYVQLGLGDLANIVLPFGSLGFEVRWGV